MTNQDKIITIYGIPLEEWDMIVGQEHCERGGLFIKFPKSGDDE